MRKQVVKSTKSTLKKPKKAIDATYNAYKEFAGKQYTGMKVGRSHKWYYNKGTWKETKKTPDVWQFHYDVTKRRAGKAPEGSGAPLETEYNWLIIAHQNVKKVDANSYTTAMEGFKYKIAHKRAKKETWSTSYRGQRKKIIECLQELIDYLKEEETQEIKSTASKNQEYFLLKDSPQK